MLPRRTTPRRHGPGEREGAGGASRANGARNPLLRLACPTALTGCISGLRLAEAAQKAHEQAATMTDRPLFEERMKNAIVHHPGPDEPIMEAYKPEP